MFFNENYYKKFYNTLHFPMDVNPILIFIFLIYKYFHSFNYFLIKQFLKNF